MSESMLVNCENTSTRCFSARFVSSIPKSASSFDDCVTPRASSSATRRGSRNLTELHERAEDWDGRRGEALRADRLAHVGVRGDADVLVEIALLAAELHGRRELGLRRELLGDVALHAAKQERRDELAQRGEALLVAALLEWLAIPATERELVAEEARRQEVEERPELAEVVLDGCR